MTASLPSSTIDLAVENATALERALETLTRRIDALDVPVDRLWNPSTCPAAHLPWLAFALSIDTWREDWPVETKRAAIAASLRIHRRKGTVGAVRDAVGAVALNSAVTVHEWFQPDQAGLPFTAIVETDVTDVVDPRADLTDDLVNAARASKNVRTHLTVRVAARLGSRTGVLGRLSPPLVVAGSQGDAHYVPGFSTGLISQASTRKPVVVHRRAGHGRYAQTFAAGQIVQAAFRTPLLKARIEVEARFARPFSAVALSIAANLRRPAVVTHLNVLGATA